MYKTHTVLNFRVYSDIFIPLRFQSLFDFFEHFNSKCFHNQLIFKVEPTNSKRYYNVMKALSTLMILKPTLDLFHWGDLKCTKIANLQQ